MKVIAIIAAYNEADIIGPVLRALGQEGVLVYLIDNCSTDHTRAVAESFLGHGLLGIERYPAGPAEAGLERFDWRGLLKRKEELARTLDADWFVHQDADEFRESAWPNERLVDGIARVDAAGYNAIDFELLNFYPADDAWLEGEDPRPVMRSFQPGAPWDKVQIKCWKKTSAVDLESSGGHEARFEGRRVCPVRFLLRHYPIRSQAHGERKVFVDRQPRMDPTERSMGWHVQYDAMAPGYDFLHATAPLQEFYPDRVRLQLMLRHRDFEELESLLDVIREHVADTEARATALRNELAAVEQQLAATCAEHERQTLELSRVSEERSAILQRIVSETERRLAAEHAWTERQRGMEELNAENDELRRHRDSLLLSRTWRWSAPVRRIAAWLMGVR